MALTKTEYCRDAMKIDSPKEDEMIDRMRQAAESWLLEKIGLPIEETEFTEYHDGGDKPTIILNNYPIRDEGNLELWDDTARAFGSTTKIAAANYTIYTDTGKIKLLLGSTFADGEQNVKVIYKAGICAAQGSGDPTAPMEIQEAVWELTQLLYKMNIDKRIGVSSKGAQGGNIAFDREIPAQVQRVIDVYGRPPHAA